MGTLAEHKADCKKRLGEEFEEVHIWMDQWHGMFGGRHRYMLHHEEGIREAEERFGSSGGAAARHHVELDCGAVPKQDDYYTKKVDFLGMGEVPYKVVDKREETL